MNDIQKNELTNKLAYDISEILGEKALCGEDIETLINDYSKLYGKIVATIMLDDLQFDNSLYQKIIKVSENEIKNALIAMLGVNGITPAVIDIIQRHQPELN